MNRTACTTALTIATVGALAIFAGPATAWDDLPCGPTEATAHLCAPGEIARDGTIPNPLPTPAPVPPVPELTPPAVAPAATVPPPVAVPVGPRKKTKAQKPRLTCKQLRAVGAGNFSLFQRGCKFPKRPPIVAGEHRSQSPGPASIVSGLLSSVPVLAGDTAFASSISQGPGGRSASGGVSALERGRLVPANIPHHPWSSRTTAPHRGVAVSVSWASGTMRISVVYSASRGRSTTSVSARVVSR